MEKMENEEIATQIIKPTLLLDKERALANIDKMVEKATISGIRFRPHFKTHQSAEIGRWFRERGVTSITVSSVDMAMYFASHGWDDITIAIPINLKQFRAIESLAAKIKLGILVESDRVVEEIRRKINSPLHVWIKVDVGYHRTGVSWDDRRSILRLAENISDSDGLIFAGLLTHAGHTYGESSLEKIRAIYEQSLHKMVLAQEDLRKHGYAAQISVGDTPGCSLVEDFGQVDEVRPGNFVFYDLSQVWFGSCQEEEVAIAMAAPVIAKHPERRQIVVYCGAVHLSKEYLPANTLFKKEVPIFGGVSLLEREGWSPMFRESAVINLSQEHGIIDAEERLFESVYVGDIVAILPVHSCLTANLLGRYQTIDGEVIEMFRY